MENSNNMGFIGSLAQELPYNLEAEQSVLGAVLIDNDCVAQVLDIELGGTETEEKENIVPIENIVTYSISEEMMVELKPGAYGNRHFCSVTVFFSMDSKHKDYKKYGATIGENELILKSIVSETFQQYTMDDARANQDEISAEILKKVQAKYGDSDFVFDVSFSDIMFQ